MPACACTHRLRLQRAQPHNATLAQIPDVQRRRAQQARPSRRTAACAEQQDGDDVKYNKEFGYSRKDVILIGVGLIGLGYGLYYGLQAAGVDQLMAGNITQLIIFMGLCFGWIGSYVFRVANKKMTYVTQLEEYEEAVMKKRLEEMTEDEVQRLMQESEASRKK